MTSKAFSAGNYKGTITVHPSNGNPDVIIPVTLSVSLGNLTVSPTTLNFQQAPDGPARPSQTINIGSYGAILQFTAFPSTANWLTVNPEQRHHTRTSDCIGERRRAGARVLIPAR